MPSVNKNTIILFERVDFVFDKRKWNTVNSNPQYWKMDGVRNRFTHVYAPSFPAIETAYEKAGKKIFRPENNESDIKEDIKDSTTSSSTPNDNSAPMESIKNSDVQEHNEEEVVDNSPVTEDDFTVEDTKPNWREMKWLELRTFAKQYTDEVIKNKEHAWEILEELESQGKL